MSNSNIEEQIREVYGLMCRHPRSPELQMPLQTILLPGKTDRWSRFI